MNDKEAAAFREGELLFSHGNFHMEMKEGVACQKQLW